MDKVAGSSLHDVAFASALQVITPVIRQKTVLKSSCAVTALLALPVAMSLGVMLAAPAAAQTTIGSNKSSTVVLSNTTNYPSGNPFTVSSGVSVSGAGDAVLGNSSQNWTVSNYGTLTGLGANGVGFDNGGTLVNDFPTGSNVTSTITGATAGFYVAGAAGYVSNRGLINGAEIDGVEFNAGGTISNNGKGTITGGSNGVDVSGAAGTVSNFGSIIGSVLLGDSGGAGINLGQGGSVLNGGYVSGNTGIASELGGYIHNEGYVYANRNGIAVTGDAGTVVNDGTIVMQHLGGPPGAGVFLGAGGTVTNNGSAAITAYGIGVDVENTIGSVFNSATISGMGTVAGAGIGVELGVGGYVSNDGTVYGSLIGAKFDGFGTLVNSGTVYGNNAGVSLLDGGTVSNLNGGFIHSSGYAGVVVYNATGSINNAGYISASTYGVRLAAGGSIVNSGTIYGYIGAGLQQGSVDNSGTIGGGHVGVYFDNAGTVTNTGTINEYGTPGTYTAAGVDLHGGGLVTNFGSITTYDAGVVADNAAGTVINYGTINAYGSSTTALGVQLNHGGYVANRNGSASIYGVIDGVAVNGAAGTVVNSAGISGGVAGVVMADGGTVDNNALSQISGGTNGVEIDGAAAAAQVNNYASGAIIGQFTGVILGAGQNSLYNNGFIGGESYAGVLLMNGGSIENGASGAIEGGMFGVKAASLPASITNAGSIGGAYAGAKLYGGSVTNASGGYIGGGTFGVYIDHAGTVSNSGTIIERVGDGAGVALVNGGSVSNAAGGHIGGFFGVILDGGNVDNSGNIYGVVGVGLGSSTIGTTNTLVNETGGTIAGEFAGVFYPNGSTLGSTDLVINAQGGTIDGGVYGVGLFGTLNVLDNGGLIQGDSAAGALLFGGSVTNSATGTITGGTYGILASTEAESITNAGQISGPGNAGIMLGGGGGIVNQAGGTIGGAAGIILRNVAGSINNSGLIAGGVGVGLYDGGVITNQASGAITGDVNAIIASGAAATLINSGLVAAENPNAGTGVAMIAGGSVTNNATGTISGDYYGINIVNAAGDVGNAGSITGNRRFGVLLADGGNVTNTAGGTISSVDGVGVKLGVGGSVGNSGIIAGGDRGVGIYGEAGTVLNSGTISSSVTDSGAVLLTLGGSVNNTGLIEGGEGVQISAFYDTLGVTTGTVTNVAGATISGYYDGVNVNNETASVSNAGLISATYGYGVAIGGGTSGIVGNVATGTITGGRTGVFIDGAGTLQNAGTISGQRYYGAFLYNGGSVNNSGSINGGIDGVMLGGSYYGYRSTGTLTNSGTITGGTAGVAGYGTDFSVQNSGLIAGGTGIALREGPSTIVNAGTIDGTAGDAIDIVGGSVSNQGSIVGYDNGIVSTAALSVSNSGVIQGNGALGDGVLLGAGGTVANLAGGTITGNGGGVVSYQYAANVSNAGSIGAAGAAAVALMMGGDVTNAVGGTISSNVTGIALGAAGSIGNDGVISAGIYGVNLAGGGTLTNGATGRITGGTDGVYAPVGAAVSNSGTIIGTAGDGVLLVGGGLNNAAGGFIKGGTDGIVADAGAVVSNAGTIVDDTTAGAMLGDDVAVVNNGGGDISGATGIAFTGTGASVLDYGTIASSNGGNAISFDPAGTNTLTLSGGAVIVGTIEGGGSDSQIDLIGKGTINNTIADFGAGSAVTVRPGAFWTATGNWTVANVTNLGTFQAGTLNPDPPLVLNGNYVQAKTATLQVVVTPTMSTQFIVNGTAQLAGALKYIFSPGLYMSHVYHFLTASKGVTGSFATVDYTGDVPPAIVIDHSTNSDVVNANLVLDRGSDVPGTDGPALVRPTDDSIFTAQDEAMATEAQTVNDGLLGHAQAAASGDDQASRDACAAAERVPSGGTGMGANIASAMASAFCGAGGWVEATGTTMNVDAGGAAPEFHADTGGFLAGIDKPVNAYGGRVGLAVGYDETWLHDDAGGKGNISTTRVGLYGAQPLGRFTLAADFMYGHATDHTDRATDIGVASAGRHSNIAAGAAELAMPTMFDGFSLMPAAGLRVAHIDGGGFAESGPGYVPYFAVSGDAPDYTSVQPFVKIGASRSYVTGSNVVITPEASIGFDYEVADRGNAASETTQDGTAFRSSTNRLDRAAANVSAGLSAAKGAWSLYARYNAYLSGNWTAQTGEAGLQVKF